MADELVKLFAPAYRQGETLPTHLGLADLYSMAKYTQAGKQFGMPAIGQDQLLNKMLVEGRADAGFNEYNHTNPRAVALENEVYKSTKDSPLYLNQHVVGYPSAVLDKYETAKRLNIPFERAWNGTGTSAVTGRSGAQHAQRAKQMEKAANDPRNAAVKDFLDRAAKDQLTPKERLSIMGGNNQLHEIFQDQNNEGYLKKYMRDKNVSFDEGTQQLLASPRVLKTAYLRDQNIPYPTKPYAWEQPIQGKPGTGSPTYFERRDLANDMTELKMLERDPEVKKFIEDRLHGPIRERTVIDKFHDWLDNYKFKNPLKSE